MDTRSFVASEDAGDNIGNGESNCESLWIVPLLLWIGYCDTVGE